MSGSRWPSPRAAPSGAWPGCLAIAGCVSLPRQLAEPRLGLGSPGGDSGPCGLVVDALPLASRSLQGLGGSGVSRPCFLEACVWSVGGQLVGQAALVPSRPGVTAGSLLWGQLPASPCRQRRSPESPCPTSCGQPRPRGPQGWWPCGSCLST